MGAAKGSEGKGERGTGTGGAAGEEEERFRDPQLAINRVYTRKGDRGQTQLVGGQRVAKDDARIDAYGTVDELNAVVGAARQSIVEALGTSGPEAPDEQGRRALEGLGASLLRVQHELFNLGSLLATLPEDVHERQPRVTAEDVARLEQEMDAAQDALSPLRSFVLPGGSRLCVELHLARTVCRRAERLVVGLARQGGAAAVSVEYLNRLSDAFFVWSRAGNQALGREEVLWDPNWAGPARGKDPGPSAA